MSRLGWAHCFARWILGLIFFMAGWWKCFTLTPLGHAERLFTGPYADTWIPQPLLLVTGTLIPIVELVAGLLLVLGIRTTEAGIALGGVLVLVTYGHLLKEPLYDTTSHIFPRTVLLVFMLAVPAAEDRLRLERLWARPRA